MKTRIIRRGDAFGSKIVANGQIISCECIAPTDRIITLKYAPAKPLPQIHSINGIVFIDTTPKQSISYFRGFNPQGSNESGLKPPLDFLFYSINIIINNTLFNPLIHYSYPNIRK
ncbi:hypothetical protein BMS3Abin05_01971 [bacterium BMS3Abin05]|nr:hypothetical protein BMS3Abin05_01971 [bacterium BMS3Abin05]GBE27390.1 hypothetical protein BMS3Bbin03_01315 [bacterium BMS3Bbin03]